MGQAILNAIATPEAENNGLRDPRARAEELATRSRCIAGELAIALEGPAPVDWEQDLERGGGPCLALGAERRIAFRPRRQP